MNLVNISRRLKVANLFFLICMLLLSCSGNKNVKPIVTADDQYSHALRLYNKEDYEKARVEFQKLIFNYPSSPLIVDAKYYLADCYYLKKDYLLAANEFKRFSEDYSQSQLAPIALFKAGEAYYKLSKRPELTQDETKKALDALQLLIIKYPGNSIVERAREEISKCHNKLATKEYINGKFYFKLKFYDAALIYLEPILEGYPDVAITPKVLYLVAISYDKLDQKDKAQKTREDLASKYPNSSETKKLLEEYPGLMDQVKQGNN